MAYIAGTGPCGACGTVLDWYVTQGKQRYWYCKEKATGENHWDNCAGANAIHERMAAVTANLKESV